MKTLKSTGSYSIVLLPVAVSSEGCSPEATTAGRRVEKNQIYRTFEELRKTIHDAFTGYYPSLVCNQNIRTDSF